MLDIYLVRHAEEDREKRVNGEKLGASLTKEGKGQVNLLIKRLKNKKFNKIYSSDLIRCKETAEPIAKELGLKINYNEGLREVDIEVKHHPENHKEEITTIKKITNKIIKEKGRILVITSGVVIRIIIGLIMKLPLKQCNFIQHNTGMTHIKFTKDKILTIYVNNTQHLK